MKQKELDEIIKLHEKWVVGNCNGKRADLSNVDLSGKDLSNANLRYANLNGTDLSDANLSYVYLKGANLSNANLSDADLSDANLINANLRSVNLSGANFRGADLSDADLENSILYGVNLSDATLNWVNWHEAKGIDVYVAGLQSSRHNAQLTYIPSLDVATTGCWQNTWEATKKRVKDVYKESDPKIYRKYLLAFRYIEGQIVEDKGEVIKDDIDHSLWDLKH